MKVLVINSGSSSLKYQLYDMTDESVLAKGLVERIGMDSSILTHKPTGKDEVVEVSEILEHNTAIRKVIDKLTDSVHGVLSSVDEINAIGHRVVHGGEFFNESALVDKDAKKNIRALIDLAPLHNPAAVMGIEASEINMPGVPQVVVFDTAFHQTMPEKAYLYAIPRVLYNKYKVRRYGFHGTSHYYVSLAAAEFLNKPIEDLKIITAHIGNGGSLTAIQGGVSVDTSMGMTPLEGLMMGTRSGDLDPAIVPYVMNKEELSVSEVNSMLNKHSGLLAISGVSSDMRDITDGWEKGEANATLAFEMYEYRLRKYIGSYAAAMNGVDVLIFTAGVGENSAIVRKAVCDNLSYLGIEIDEELNKIRSGDPRRISTPNSKVEVLVVPTNEELVIARDTFRIVEESKA